MALKGEEVYQPEINTFSLIYCIRDIAMPVCNPYKNFQNWIFPIKSQIFNTHRWLTIIPNDSLNQLLNLTFIRRHFYIQIINNLKKTLNMLSIDSYYIGKLKLSQIQSLLAWNPDIQEF